MLSAPDVHDLDAEGSSVQPKQGGLRRPSAALSAPSEQGAWNPEVHCRRFQLFLRTLCLPVLPRIQICFGLWPSYNAGDDSVGIISARSQPVAA